MRRLSLVFLVLLAVAGCAKSPTTVSPPPPLTDPFYVVILRPDFTTLYPATTTSLAVTVHAIVDSGNPDPGSVPADFTNPSLMNGTCGELAGGNNGGGVAFHLVVTVRPTDKQTGDTVGVGYQSDTLDVSPDAVPYPEPWGRDPYHLLLWKLKISDASATRPSLLTFQLDTISFSRLSGRDTNPFTNTGGCQALIP